ncbi:histamine H2 receptor-like [Stylophora pistillata]|uniref:histamine H2 receptor-like n=1 Tax=Stylophora pistillata TaxID=50429 RepID=UPI000C03C81C|nr:histamine H2 receptor-like [Stylophora pistillata]
MGGLDDHCQDCESKKCFYGLGELQSIIFVFLCSICGLLAIGGNLTLLVIFRYCGTVREKMNNIFVVSLAMADLIIGLMITPLYICYGVAFEPPWLVKLEGFLWIVTTSATTHSLSAVSIDRLISVIYPLRYHEIITKKRCAVIIALIWLGSVIFGSPRLFINDFQKLEKLWITCSIATVAVPLLIMCYSYGRIYTIVREKHGDLINNPNDSREGFVNKKAAVTIGIIVCLFIVTFTPSAVVYFMLLFEDDICKEFELNNSWLWVALVSFYHSAFNPWVYGFRHEELRKCFKKLFDKKCKAFR